MLSLVPIQEFLPEGGEGSSSFGERMAALLSARPSSSVQSLLLLFLLLLSSCQSFSLPPSSSVEPQTSHPPVLSLSLTRLLLRGGGEEEALEDLGIAAQSFIEAAQDSLGPMLMDTYEGLTEGNVAGI